MSSLVVYRVPRSTIRTLSTGVRPAFFSIACENKLLFESATWTCMTKERQARVNDVLRRYESTNVASSSYSELCKKTRAQLQHMCTDRGMTPGRRNKDGLIRRLRGEDSNGSMNPGKTVEHIVRNLLRTRLAYDVDIYSSAIGSSHPKLVTGFPGKTDALRPDGICHTATPARVLSSELYPGIKFPLPIASDGFNIEVKTHLGTTGTADEKIFGAPMKYSLVFEKTRMPTFVFVSGITENFLHRAGSFGKCRDHSCACHTGNGAIRIENMKFLSDIWETRYHVFFVPVSSLCRPAPLSCPATRADHSTRPQVSQHSAAPHGGSTRRVQRTRRA